MGLDPADVPALERSWAGLGVSYKREWLAWEQPASEVTIRRPFLMAETETSWQEFMQGSSPAVLHAELARERPAPEVLRGVARGVARAAARRGRHGVQLGGAAREHPAEKVAELKDLLRGRGLKVSGKKAELVERLEESD